MVIQRLQSLYLLISAILLAVFSFSTSFTIATSTGVYHIGVLRKGYENGIMQPDLLLLPMVVLLIVLSIIAIFKFKDLKSQLRLCAICIALTLAMILSIGFLAFTQREMGMVSIGLSNLLVVASLLFFFLAHRGIARDKKLLTDSDRLR